MNFFLKLFFFIILILSHTSSADSNLKPCPKDDGNNGSEFFHDCFGERTYIKSALGAEMEKRERMIHWPIWKIQGSGKSLIGGPNPPHGTKYIGEWKNNLRHGQGEMVFSDGSTIIGQWKSNWIWGYAEAIYANGIEYKGNWISSMKDGEGIQTYINGDKFEGEWYLGSPILGTYYYNDGDKYTGKSIRSNDIGREARAYWGYSMSFLKFTLDPYHVDDFHPWGFGKLEFKNGEYIECIDAFDVIEKNENKVMTRELYEKILTETPEKLSEKRGKIKCKFWGSKDNILSLPNANLEESMLLKRLEAKSRNTPCESYLTLMQLHYNSFPNNPDKKYIRRLRLDYKECMELNYR